MLAAMLLQLAAATLLLTCSVSGDPVVTGSFNDSSAAIRAGASTQFSCRVQQVESAFSVRLLCPLATGSCFENCLRVCADSEACSDRPLLLRVSCKTWTIGGVSEFVFNLTDADVAHSGDWSCRHKSISSEISQLRVLTDPTVKSASFNGTSREGETAMATCVAAESGGTLELAWRRVDGSKLPTNATDVASNATTRLLLLRNVSRQDAGEFKCVVSNEAGGLATGRASLTVEFPPSRASLTASVASPQTAGTVVTFGCDVDGGQPTPTTTILRRRDGGSSQTVASTLTLEAADNNAEFSCVASGAGSEVASANSLTFNVLFPPSSARLRPAAKEVAEGATVEFNCSADSSSNPASAVVWRVFGRDGLQLTLPSGTSATSQSAGGNGGSLASGRLSLTATRQLHCGSVQCALQHRGAEVAQAVANLTVTFAPVAVKLTASPNSSLPENSTLTLVCSATAANPAVSVEWQLTVGASVVNLTASATTRAVADAGSGGFTVESSLQTRATRAVNGGAVSCVARHSGSVLTSGSHQLLVLFTPDATVEASGVSEGATASLRCRVSGGSPATGFSFAWLRRDAGTWTSLAASSSTLELAGVTRALSGRRFRCVVTSAAGQTFADVTLTVWYAPTLLPTSLTLVTAAFGESATLAAEVDASPTDVTVQWLRPHAATGVDVFVDGANSTRLWLPSLTAADFGWYVAVVNNSAGASRFTFCLGRPGAPAAPTQPKVANVTAVGADVSWISGFDGGAVQTFVVEWRRADDAVWLPGNRVSRLSDPGRGETASVSLVAMDAATDFLVRVFAVNVNGSGDASAAVAMTTKQLPSIANWSLAAVVTGQVAQLYFQQPQSSAFTSVLARVCAAGDCVLRSLLTAEVTAGRATLPLTSTNSISFQLVVMDGEVEVFRTSTFWPSDATAEGEGEGESGGVSAATVAGVGGAMSAVVAVLVVVVIVTAVVQRRRRRPASCKSAGSTNSSDVAASPTSPTLAVSASPPASPSSQSAPPPPPRLRRGWSLVQASPTLQQQQQQYQQQQQQQQQYQHQQQHQHQQQQQQQQQHQQQQCRPPECASPAFSVSSAFLLPPSPFAVSPSPSQLQAASPVLRLAPTPEELQAQIEAIENYV